jgi:hypothetical protein
VGLSCRATKRKTPEDCGPTVDFWNRQSEGGNRSGDYFTSSIDLFSPQGVRKSMDFSVVQQELQHAIKSVK